MILQAGVAKEHCAKTAPVHELSGTAARSLAKIHISLLYARVINEFPSCCSASALARPGRIQAEGSTVNDFGLNLSWLRRRGITKLGSYGPPQGDRPANVRQILMAKGA